MIRNYSEHRDQWLYSIQHSWDGKDQARHLNFAILSLLKVTVFRPFNEKESEAVGEKLRELKMGLKNSMFNSLERYIFSWRET